ncbi:MAG: hypothetical protein KAS17_07475, partial [Victivallaceae bacterium]|nr:hypothetical protein [Victivallaceae bacterium]
MKKQIRIMVQAKPVLPGSLAEHYNVCGKAQCCCKDKINPRKHGPYYRLSYSLKNKNSSISVKKEDAPIIKEMTENYRQSRSNSLELGLEMIELYHQDGLQGMRDKYEKVLDSEMSKKTGTKAASIILRETRSSRDKWKTKALERQAEIAKNQVKVRDLEKSRDNWKAKAMQAKKENQGLCKELEKSKKNYPPIQDKLIDSPPSKFKYPLKTVVIAIKLVVSGLLSLRGVKRTLALFNHCFKGGVPCHAVVQNWLMRYGLYKLRQTPKRRNDWVFFLDHSIEFGKKQCLLVLGVTLEEFRKNKCKLRHKDMEVLAVDIVESATAASVTGTLENITEDTGIPAQIISDGGLNIVRGSRDFIEQNASGSIVRQTYDVTHKTALILKHQLKDDKIWQAFCAKIAESKRSIVHTELGFLSPPKPRDKSRWQNLDAYVKWAEMILKQKTKSMSRVETEKFTAKLSWLQEYKSHISEWRMMLDILHAVKMEVKTNGFRKQTKAKFKKSISSMKINSLQLKDIRDEVFAYIEDECAGIRGVYPGCSDIIESVFGKYKNFSGKSPMKEIGRAVLTIPVFTSNVDYKEVKVAMESISAK